MKMAVAAPKKDKPRRKANIPLADVGLSNSSRLLKEKNEALIKSTWAKYLDRSFKGSVR